MLLKEIDNKHFLLKIRKNGKSIFEDYIFFLELYLIQADFLQSKETLLQILKYHLQ